MRQTHTSQALPLRVEHLSWHSDGQPILHDISFTLAPGRMLGVLGPNGAGKSTLLRCLYRYLTPSQGQIFYGDKPLAVLSQRELAQHMAVVLQHAPQGFSLSVAQILTTGLLAEKNWWQWADPKADRQVISQALEQIGLLDKQDTRFERLSGGEQQRVMIARALLQKPSLLLLDEPTNHLDVHYQIEILQLVKSLGISVICTIHDLNLAAAFCDDILLLNKGEVAAFGTPNTVFTAEILNPVYGIDCLLDIHPVSGDPRITLNYHGAQYGGR